MAVESYGPFTNVAWMRVEQLDPADPTKVLWSYNFLKAKQIHLVDGDNGVYAQGVETADGIKELRRCGTAKKNEEVRVLVATPNPLDPAATGSLPPAAQKPADQAGATSTTGTATTATGQPTK